MKSGKSVERYAKVRGGRSTTPLQKWQKCETFVENGLWHNLANYEKWQKCETVCKSWGGSVKGPPAKVAKV